MLYNIIISVIILISFLLILVILLQPGQKEGLSGGLAAGMVGGAGMGARRTADLLSSTTSVLATAFLVLSLLANFAISTEGTGGSTLQEQGLDALPQNETDFSIPSESESAVPQLPMESESAGPEETEDN